MHKTIGVLILAISALPALLFGQKNEIISLQRDVANMDEHVRQIQKTQDEKLEAIRQLAQQALDASGKTAASITSLEHSVTTTLADQQKRVLDPLVDLRTKTSQTSDDVSALRENVADLQRRVNSLDSKISDILTTVHLLAQPPAPPPAAAAPAPTPNAQLGGAPPGLSATTLFEDARRDYSGGREELAMKGFVDLVKYFPDDANAPLATYYIGMLFDKDGQFDEAAKAFGRVVEHYANNPKTCESMFRKGEELRKANQRVDATDAYNDYLKSCPGDERRATAVQQLRALGGTVAPPRNTKKR